MLDIKSISYRIIFSLFLFVHLGCARQIDKDEIVLGDYIVEKNGKYYRGDCREHATRYYTGTDTFYHENGKVKGTFTIKRGLPDGHWEQFNFDGSKKLDLYYDNGKLINKVFHKKLN